MFLQRWGIFLISISFGAIVSWQILQNPITHLLENAKSDSYVISGLNFAGYFFFGLFSFRQYFPQWKTSGVLSVIVCTAITFSMINNFQGIELPISHELITRSIFPIYVCIFFYFISHNAFATLIAPAFLMSANVLGMKYGFDYTHINNTEMTFCFCMWIFSIYNIRWSTTVEV